MDIRSLRERGTMSPLSIKLKFPPSSPTGVENMTLGESTNSTSAVIRTCWITSNHCRTWRQGQEGVVMNGG